MINEARLIADFLDLVRLSSPSFKEGAVMAVLAAKVRAAGFEPQFDEAGEQLGGEVGNLFFTVPGNRPGAPPIFLNAHVDTVVPCTPMMVVEDGDLIRTDGSCILGGDDKTGVMTVLEAVRTVVEHDLPHGELEVAFTIAEEIGLKGAFAFDTSRLKSKLAFVFDGGTPIGRVINAAPSQANLTFHVKGRAAHAGVCPEQGVSAIVIAAQAIAAMQLLRIDEETTANIGIIAGGEATNIVTERVRVVAEARSRNRDKLRAQLDHMRQCFMDAATATGGTVEVEEVHKYAGYVIREDAEILRVFHVACARLGIEPCVAASGGGADTNVWNERGLQSVVVNCGQQKVHTLDECVDVRDLAQSARLCVELIQSVA